MNPFLLHGYEGPTFFCDREVETQRLISNALNGQNTVLVALRRMGKTGLIRHVIHNVSQSKACTCIYVDLYGTSTMHDFVNQLASALFKQIPTGSKLGKNLLTLIRSLSAVVSYDPLNGQPQVSLGIQPPRQAEHTLNSLLHFLEKQQTRFLICLDEFQQVIHYPEKNAEALIRAEIQHLTKVNFIFSGSNRTLITAMFTGAKRPFYQSAAYIQIQEIEHANYAQFIALHFEKANRTISVEGIEFLLAFSRRHTYYTQFLCNRVFSQKEKHLSLEVIKRVCDEILNEWEPQFLQLRKLLTQQQWRLLQAIALEENATEITGKNFIRSHDLGAPSSIKRSLDALIEKELVYDLESEFKTTYTCADCFMARWFQRNAMRFPF